MKCLNCGKEIVSQGTKPKKYCSDACRMAYKRTKQTNSLANEREQTNKPEQTPEPKTIEDVIALTAGEAQAVLDQWLVSGTPYQRRLAALDRAYTFIYA